jgi:hypothetical protein
MTLDEELMKTIEETRTKYEFLTFVIFKDDIIHGIVQNETPKILMIYEFDLLRTADEKKVFLRYGDDWWWGSNHSVPINLFIGDRFEVFDYVLKGYPKKPIESLIGPSFNLADRYLRRVKKKRIDVIIPKTDPVPT